MNLQAAWLAPWQATQKSLRWLTLGIFAACCLGAIGVGVLVQGTHWWLVSAGVYCLGIGYLWAFLLSSLLLVSIDARQLRIPGMVQTAVWSLIFYGAPSVAVPAVVLGVCGAPALTVALLAALAVTAGLAVVLLPGYLVMMMSLLPAMSIGLSRLVHISSLADPRFVPWAVVALFLLLLVDILRWRQLLHTQPGGVLGMSSAMVLRLRTNGGLGKWSRLAQQQNASRRLRQRPDWMQGRADLRRVGPRRPVATLRVALGGWYVPQTWSSYVRQATPVLLPILLFVPMMAIMQGGEVVHGDVWRKVWLDVGINVIVWIGIFGGPLLAILTAFTVRQRWTRLNAELPLLALLPGLGDVAAMRRNLLRAALVGPFLAQTVALMLLLGTAMAVHMGSVVMLFVALSQVGCAGVVAALVLDTFGGDRLPAWGTAVLSAAAFVLVSLSSFIPLTGVGRKPWHFAAAGEWLLALGWVAMAGMLLWLGRRGLRGLQARPHPFLPN